MHSNISPSLLLARDTEQAPKSCEQNLDVAHRIYMDHNGSAPMVDCARVAMLPFLDAGYGNPSSGHWASEASKHALQTGRQAVAELLGAEASEIDFTSGATEANNMAIKGSWYSGCKAGSHIITSSIEHEAVLKPVRVLRSLGARVTVLPVDRQEIVDPDAVR